MTQLINIKGAVLHNLCTWSSHACITLIMAHMHPLRHLQVEPKPEIQVEQAQIEAFTNVTLD
jgi:hypothetical protein